MSTRTLRLKNSLLFVHYAEMYEIISDYLDYQPGIPADLFWETYKDSYPSLTKEDYYAIVNEISMAGCDAEGMDANGKEDC